MRSIDGKRRNDRVHARAVCRRASTIGDDSSTRRPTAETILSMTRMRWSVVFEHHLGFFQHAAALDVNLLCAVHQDVTDGWILEQGLERAETVDFIENLASHGFSLGGGKRRLDLSDDALDDSENLRLCSLGWNGRDGFEIELVQKITMNSDFYVFVGAIVETSRPAHVGGAFRDHRLRKFVGSSHPDCVRRDCRPRPSRKTIASEVRRDSW